MSTELNFKLMFGLKLNEEMPEQLRTSLGDYLEEAVKKYVEPGLDDIVKQYAEERGMSKEKSMLTRSRGIEKIPSEDMPEDSSKIGEYFSRLARKKSKVSNSSFVELVFSNSFVFILSFKFSNKIFSFWTTKKLPKPIFF